MINFAHKQPSYRWVNLLFAYLQTHSFNLWNQTPIFQYWSLLFHRLHAHKYYKCIESVLSKKIKELPIRLHKLLSSCVERYNNQLNKQLINAK
jgi:hypothetical protein